MVYPNPQIYQQLRTIFVHVPKTAGTAIERALLQGSKGTVGGHTTALGYRSTYPEVFEHYFKFSVIRHPVDRFVSAFYYLRQQKIHPALNNQVIHECDTIDEFVKWVEMNPALVQKIVHLLPQHMFLCDAEGLILVDQVYDYDKLPEAWADISERIGITYIPLVKINVSQRPGNFKPSMHVVNLVRKLYALDYDIFKFNQLSPVTSK
ncbi:MAG: sulfotransferase family protein [Prosthecobacter sp.]|nr:sulfotransferase family protein [Prosthecobacter sp.]